MAGFLGFEHRASEAPRTWSQQPSATQASAKKFPDRWLTPAARRVVGRAITVLARHGYIDLVVVWIRQSAIKRVMAGLAELQRLFPSAYPDKKRKQGLDFRPYVKTITLPQPAPEDMRYLGQRGQVNGGFGGGKADDGFPSG